MDAPSAALQPAGDQPHSSALTAEPQPGIVANERACGFNKVKTGRSMSAAPQRVGWDPILGRPRREAWSPVRRARRAAVAFACLIVSFGQTEVDARADDPPPPSVTSFTSSVSAVTVPDSFTLSATLDRDLGPTPYSVEIIDDDTGFPVGGCGSGTVCRIEVGTSYSDDNANPRTRHFHAEITGTGGPFGRSGQVSVEIRRFIFVVDLAITGQRTDEQGNVLYTLRATTNRDVGPTPYSIVIRNSQDSTIGGCGSGTVCDIADVPADTYRASVEGGETVFGSSSVDGLDLAGLSALFASTTDVCTELAFMPGTHVERSTLNDAAIECEKARAAGLTSRETIARIVAVGGGTLAAWLGFTASLDDDAFPASLDDDAFPPSPVPGEPPPPPPYRPEPPQTLPGVWDPPIATAAGAIRVLNPGAEISDAQAQTIARRCVWLAAQAELGVSVCGKDNLPIFVTGADVAEATQHDIEALGRTPSWVQLNYVSSGNQIGPRRWYANDPACATASQPDGLDCDEFPFYSTRQGGRSASPRPDLKIITASNNRSQGASLSAFYSACAMRSGIVSNDGFSISGGDPFLLVPIPIAPVSLPLCNGKSTTNQP